MAREKEPWSITLMCDSCQDILNLIPTMSESTQFQLLARKNVFQAPSLLGYRFFVFTIQVICEEKHYVCNVYVTLRSYVRAIVDMIGCLRDNKDWWNKLAKIMPVSMTRKTLKKQIWSLYKVPQRDVIVKALAQKAQGIFLYASMLQKELQQQSQETLQLRSIVQLPVDVNGFYNSNFDRLSQRVPWSRCARWVALLTVTREPLPVDLLQQVFCLFLVSAFSQFFFLDETRHFN